MSREVRDDEALARARIAPSVADYTKQRPRSARGYRSRSRYHQPTESNCGWMKVQGQVTRDRQNLVWGTVPTVGRCSDMRHTTSARRPGVLLIAC